MRRYFLSDTHIGPRLKRNGRVCKANDFHGKEALMFALVDRIKAEDARLWIIGDFLEWLASSLFGIVDSNIELLRAISEVLDGWVPGNHDPPWLELPPDWRRRLKLHAQNHAVIDLDGQRVWLEHGHAFDNKNWLDWKLKWAARAAYWAESNLHQDLDDWGLAVWRWYLNRQRKTRNEPSHEMPYAWAARKRWREHPELNVVMTGHSHSVGRRDELDRLHIDTGCWTRNPDGKECEDVTVYDTIDGWWQGNVRGLV